MTAAVVMENVNWDPGKSEARSRRVRRRRRRRRRSGGGVVALHVFSRGISCERPTSRSRRSDFG